MRTRAIAFVLAAACGAARPSDLDAVHLYEACNSSQDIEQTACRFYILGVVQGAGLVDGSGVGTDGRLVAKQRERLCPPPGMLQSEMVDVFRDVMRSLLRTRSDDAKAPAQSIVLAAMHSRFPCR
jgi:hypothetical protein